ncbi:DciA family protein [Rhodopila sp.]|uniref:DciA family protein n=1 Tax=Rhodopila sp. TaxID=2480087 RepID=UPI003D0EE5C2
MADDDTRTGMTGQGRFVYGPRALGSVVPGIARRSFRKHNPASAQIVADWEVIVGPKVASMTMPRRLDRGVLTIACAGPAAMDLHYMGVEVINRINTHLGGRPVHSLKFTQAGMPKVGPAVNPAPPEAIVEAEAAVADLPDSELKSALAALGRVVIGRSKHSTRRLKKR